MSGRKTRRRPPGRYEIAVYTTPPGRTWRHFNSVGPFDTFDAAVAALRDCPPGSDIFEHVADLSPGVRRIRTLATRTDAVVSP